MAAPDSTSILQSCTLLQEAAQCRGVLEVGTETQMTGPRGIAKATAQHLEVGVALVSQWGVGCLGGGGGVEIRCFGCEEEKEEDDVNNLEEEEDLEASTRRQLSVPGAERGKELQLLAVGQATALLLVVAVPGLTSHSMEHRESISTSAVNKELWAAGPDVGVPSGKVDGPCEPVGGAFEPADGLQLGLLLIHALLQPLQLLCLRLDTMEHSFQRILTCLLGRVPSESPSEEEEESSGGGGSEGGRSSSGSRRPNSTSKPTGYTLYRRKKTEEEGRRVLEQAKGSTTQGKPGNPCGVCRDPRRRESGHAFFNGEFYCPMEQGCSGVAGRPPVPWTTLWNMKKRRKEQEAPQNPQDKNLPEVWPVFPQKCGAVARRKESEEEEEEEEEEEGSEEEANIQRDILESKLLHLNKEMRPLHDKIKTQQTILDNCSIQHNQHLEDVRQLNIDIGNLTREKERRAEQAHDPEFLRMKLERAKMQLKQERLRCDSLKRRLHEPVKADGLQLGLLLIHALLQPLQLLCLRLDTMEHLLRQQKHKYSTTSITLVAGVTGASVSICWLSLRYTVRITCSQANEEVADDTYVETAGFVCTADSYEVHGIFIRHPTLDQSQSHQHRSSENTHMSKLP
ncbi:hypothetical protein CRUP_008063 [Coryphaenoides rupestris]|nr:hypothetical protein CRUP_008063 [Coryphaenoides rupestris]